MPSCQEGFCFFQIVISRLFWKFWIKDISKIYIYNSILKRKDVVVFFTSVRRALIRFHSFFLVKKNLQVASEYSHLRQKQSWRQHEFVSIRSNDKSDTELQVCWVGCVVSSAILSAIRRIRPMLDSPTKFVIQKSLLLISGHSFTSRCQTNKGEIL